jgi:hypothetical protein
MTFALRLSHDEPRLVYLALVYHLARPGSELDPATGEPMEHGLREVKLALGRDLQAESAVIELDASRYRKLLSAIFGSVNELRVMHMRGGTSDVPRFAETAREIFPQLAADPEEALALAESMMMLHRRMERAVRAAGAPSAAPEPGRKRRWPFGR